MNGAGSRIPAGDGRRLAPVASGPTLESGGISVVVPVYNEVANLAPLFDRTVKTLGSLGRPWELIFVDDGSGDGSLPLLLDLRRIHSANVRVIELSRNFGQHAAVLAGLRAARARVVVTLDGDLQDPPEEIPKLIACFDAGHDVVGGYRAERQDSRFRRWGSRLVNEFRARTTSLAMRDQGCMLRAYAREVVDVILESRETITFIPALAQLYASNPTDVLVAHAPRVAGTSKYHFWKLIRLNFDLITGFTAAPLQVFSMLGFAISVFSAGLVVLLAIRRLVIGPEAEGLFTLFGILFFLVGVCITGIGILGEYVSRIYHEVRRRPPYVIRKVHQDGEAS